MSDDLRDLYQEVILEHARKPRNFRLLDGPGVHRAEGFNRLCGDRLFVYVLVEDGIVKDVSFQGTGCAISTASASMMTQALKGRSAAEASALFARFHHLVTVGEDSNERRATARMTRRRTRQARRLRRRARVPGAGEVRDAGVAHAARGARSGERCRGFDGRVTASQQPQAPMLAAGEARP